MFHLNAFFRPFAIQASIATGVNVVDVDSAKAAAAALREKGCKTVVLTLGENGAVFGPDDSGSFVHVRTRRVEALDSTVSRVKSQIADGNCPFFFCQMFRDVTCHMCRSRWSPARPQRDMGPYCGFLRDQLKFTVRSTG